MSEGSGSDKELFSLHPEFQNGVTISQNTISWSQYGYAVSEKKFTNGIWKIKVRFDEIPAIAWFGILKCDEDKFDKGNVHDRTGLCVYHSNGFCNQSGFSYGNNPWKSEDVITLEVNLTQPTNPTLSQSVSSSSVDLSSLFTFTETIYQKPPTHPFVVSAPTPSYLSAQCSFVVSAPFPSYLAVAETIKRAHPFVISAPSPSYKAFGIEPISSSSSSSSITPVISQNPTFPVVSPPSLTSDNSSHPFVVSAPSPSYKAAVVESSTSSSGSSSSKSISLPSSSSYDSSTTQPSFNTLHFYVNDQLQPVSYVNIPAPLRFIVYCNYGDSKCEILSIEEVEKEKSAYFLLKQGGADAPTVAEVWDQEEKDYKARVVTWNPEWKRSDR